MNITHSRSDPALSHTVKAPMEFLDEGGDSHWIHEWSLESAVRPESLASAAINGDLAINFQGFVVFFPIALVEGPDPDRLYFDRLDARKEELLRRFYVGVQSGQMVPIDHIIHSIDLPVEKVPMYLTAEDRIQNGKRTSRWLRALYSLLVFVLVAVLVFGSLGYTLWYRSNFVEAENARLVLGQDGQLAVQAWVPDAEITNTWTGMAGYVVANVDGTRLRFAGRIDGMIDGSEAGAGSVEGYLVRFTLYDPDTLPAEFAAGRPVDVLLDRGLLTGPRSWISGLWGAP